MGSGGSSQIEIFEEGELEQELKKKGAAGDDSIQKYVADTYNDMISSVIRPPRCVYDVADLGDTTIGLDNGQEARRKDLTLLNERDLKIECSYWQLFDTSATSPTAAPCLVYLHSNLGSRVDALRVRDQALDRGMSVFAFDFSGSGQSDGLFVTMGWNEATDLHSVLEHLDKDPSVKSFCFYAHSMGTYPAIANVVATTRDAKQRKKLQSLPASFRRPELLSIEKPIKGMVLDGGYATMTKLVQELMSSIKKEGFDVPSAVFRAATIFVEKSVKKRTDVDLDRIRPIELVPFCLLPALFLTGHDDKYVHGHHSEQLANKYKGPSMIQKVQGEHYTSRPTHVYDTAIDFLFGALHSSVEMK